MLHSPCDTAESFSSADRHLMSPSLWGVGMAGGGLSPPHQTFLAMMHWGAGGCWLEGVLVASVCREPCVLQGNSGGGRSCPGARSCRVTWSKSSDLQVLQLHMNHMVRGPQNARHESEVTAGSFARPRGRRRGHRRARAQR